MDFEPTGIQGELAEGIRRLLAGAFPLDQLRTRENQEKVIDRDGWTQLAEAGVFSLCLAEEAGGVGLGLAEATLVFEQLGRSLVPGPLVATHLAAGLVDGAEDGSVVVGMVERPSGPSANVLPVFIEHLADLDVLLVLSDRGIEQLDPATLSARPSRRPMDPLTPVWSVSSLPEGEPVAGPEIVAWWRRDGRVLTAALQVGLAAWLTDLSVAYAKERQQFGRPIGSFQAVKHLCADMTTRVELARVGVQAAGVTIDQPDVGAPDVVAAGAKIVADEAAITNGRSAIQVHGGMGFTWEVPVHLAYKRARLHATQFGTADRLAEMIADALADGLGGPTDVG
jgi:alkylation response protein AidB-like acyl-CoA dehydrogenase